MKARIILSAIALFCFGFVASAQDLKIGYTNVEYIMSLMPEMEQIDADIQDYSNQLGQQIQTKTQSFQQQVASYQQSAQTMTDEARATKERELQGMEQEIQKFQQDAQSSYQRKLQELLEPVQTKVYNAINAVAAENNYTHVFSEAAGQSPVLLYTKDNDPFTDLVLAKLGLEAPATPAPAPGSN
ncbi:periplasmic chaperone for outer membrane proteins Skp [Cyclobacterium xiamenense]|uniref:Periplasmic chaperone for outer membrane proteins Skp n=1 Tax=Cyclobacterium xiamenense TaxID=1297121 RepID=A0A1H6VQE3_9BACT|nr:OmpH family outer membrane protein [Cyclobacterium xiamenense]SEJ04007.1 periplasmic chaperone for outer membrane proteins Skp [Cyclobacterium xiamenense]